MDFYLDFPMKNALLHNLQKGAEQRLKVYDYILNSNDDNQIQLKNLTDNLAEDNAIHYLFRLASIKFKWFLNVFIKYEVKLLDFRLQHYDSENTKSQIVQLKEQANKWFNREDGKLKTYYHVLIQVCEQFQKKEFFEHAFRSHTNICDECKEYRFKVPFDQCIDLVPTREYDMTDGYLYVYSYQWKTLFVSLYKTYLGLAMNDLQKNTRAEVVFQDERIRLIMKIIKCLSSRWERETADAKQGSFKLNSIDEEYTKFPPCMRKLYESLKETNRLSHQDRFDFGLFLKGIGLSMDDALKLWEEAYSKEHSTCAKCQHTWEGNEKRYIYSIRHLYGLEGAGKDYCVKSCEHIQEISVNFRDEIGCPFKRADDKELKELLNTYLPEPETSKENDEKIEVIINERRCNAKTGCELYMKEFLRRSAPVPEFAEEPDNIIYHDPAKYYCVMKDIEDLF